MKVYGVRAGDEITAEIRRVYFRVVNRGSYTAAENGQTTSYEGADGSLFAEVVLRIPNRRISGDYREVVTHVSLGPVGVLALEPGDAGEQR